jgi:hypothetical protein
MTKLREHQCLTPQHHDGVKGADLGASPAGGAPLLVHLGDQHVHRLLLIEPGVQGEVSVGRFHVTIEQQWVLCRKHHCQAAGDGGLSGASLAAGYG